MVAAIRQNAQNVADLREAEAELCKLEELVRRETAAKRWEPELAADRTAAVALLRRQIDAAALQNSAPLTEPPRDKDCLELRPLPKQGRPAPGYYTRRARRPPQDRPLNHIELPNAKELNVSSGGLAADATQMAFVEEAGRQREEQDAMLDQILRGVNELHDVAKTIRTQIDIGSAIADEVGNKLDRQTERFRSANRSLGQILKDESEGCDRWIPATICLIILLALVGYLYSISS
jgi:hypothetical protein